jgi:hypothetical protein
MSDEVPALALLLSATDPTIRTRGTTILSSFLATRPATILDSFPQFLPFFLALLKDDQRDSLIFSTLNYLLYRSSKSQHSTIDPKSYLSILQYLAAFLDTASDYDRINAFVCDLFAPRKYLKCVHLLTSHGLVDDHIPALLQILAVGEGRFLASICTLLAGAVARVSRSVVRFPQATLPYVIRCLWSIDDNTAALKPGSSDRHKIAELAATILHSAIVGEHSPDVVRLCFPYIAKLKTHPLYHSGHVLTQVHGAVVAALNDETFSPEADPAPFAILAGVSFASATFAGVPANFISARAAQQKPAPVAQESVGGRALAALLDSDVSVTLQGPLAGAKPAAAAPAAVEKKTAPAPAVPRRTSDVGVKLTATATKKATGKFGGQARRRVFEFSSANKCLVWRPEKETVIKGAVLVDPATKVEQSGAMVVVKTSGKVHQIQFDSEPIATQWREAIQKASLAK